MGRRRVWWGAAAGGAAVGVPTARRPREQDLHGRVAPVTGASRGLGLRPADAPAEAVCPLAICAREPERLETAARHPSRRGLPAPARPLALRRDGRMAPR